MKIKKILFICVILLFSFMLVSCEMEGEAGNTSSSSDSSQNNLPLADTTTTGKNIKPSSPSNASTTTTGNNVVLDPTKPSREDAEKIELYMTYSEVVNILGEEGRQINYSSPHLAYSYRWTLSDGSTFDVRFRTPRYIENPQEYIPSSDRVAIASWIDDEYCFAYADIYCHTYGYSSIQIKLSGKTYDEIIALIGEPQEKSTDGGTLTCKWYPYTCSFDLVIKFDNTLRAEEILFDVKYANIYSRSLLIKKGTSYADLVASTGFYGESLTEPEYDPETKLTLYKWSILHYGGDLLVWFDEEQKIAKFKSDWIAPEKASKAVLNMTYSEAIDILGEPKYIVEDGTCQWDIAETWKTLSVKFAENADGVLIVSEVKQD